MSRKKSPANALRKMKRNKRKWTRKRPVRSIRPIPLSLGQDNPISSIKHYRKKHKTPTQPSKTSLGSITSKMMER
jgi:hypothetical protein